MSLYRYQTYYCPVCDFNFGTHEKTKLVLVHCDECRTSFAWKPGEKKPTPLLDKDAPKKCGCGRCNR